jgi:hypothetical protein
MWQFGLCCQADLRQNTGSSSHSFMPHLHLCFPTLKMGALTASLQSYYENLRAPPSPCKGLVHLPFTQKHNSKDFQRLVVLCTISRHSPFNLTHFPLKLTSLGCWQRFGQLSAEGTYVLISKPTGHWVPLTTHRLRPHCLYLWGFLFRFSWGLWSPRWASLVEQLSPFLHPISITWLFYSFSEPLPCPLFPSSTPP